MFADDTELIGESEEMLQELMNEFVRVCKRFTQTVTSSKRKVKIIETISDENRPKVSMNKKSSKKVSLQYF